MSALRLRGAFVLAALTAVAACRSSTGPKGGSTADSLNVVAGSVVPLTGSSVRVIGGALGSEYALVAFNSGTAPTSFTFSGGAGIDSSGPITSLEPSAASPSLALDPGTDAGRGAFGDAFDASLRQREISQLGPKLAARHDRTPSGVSRTLASAVPAVGDYMTFNVQSDFACDTTKKILRTGRVVAVTARAIVVADTTNPVVSGFTDAEYAGFGAMFDTLVTPVDEANFGTPSDIDSNGGRSILFYTKYVNELTPQGNSGYIGGFFFSRDLFPRVDPDPNFKCPASNEAEMFYLLVPDSLGTVNNNSRTKSLVTRTTISTVAHEYQHLINAARRLYVNHASAFEVVWLNEGLSHIAEELTFYQVAQLAPGENITSDTLQGTVRVGAFNTYMLNNALRYEAYLGSPSAFGPFHADDQLEDRGAIWSALRYLADRKGGSQAATWMALANSTTTGMPNMTAVFGSTVLSQLRDWSVSVLTDGMTSATVGSAWQQPSWDMRSILPRLHSPGFTFPLVVQPLRAGQTRSNSLTISGSYYVRFRVAPGAVGDVSWSSVGGTATPVMAVRTK